MSFNLLYLVKHLMFNGQNFAYMNAVNKKYQEHCQNNKTINVDKKFMQNTTAKHFEYITSDYRSFQDILFTILILQLITIFLLLMFASKSFSKNKSKVTGNNG